MKKKFTDEQIQNTLCAGGDDEVSEIIAYIFEMAESGSPKYSYMVASWLWHGSYGMKKDTEKSDYYLDIAVRGLIPEAIYDYAARNDGKSDVAKRQSLSYYILAAVLGDSDAIKALSDHFLYGEVVEKNDFVSGALRKQYDYLKNDD